MSLNREEMLIGGNVINNYEILLPNRAKDTQRLNLSRYQFEVLQLHTEAFSSVSMRHIEIHLVRDISGKKAKHTPCYNVEKYLLV
ncbi:hypothetical protein CEXT_57961 [Caerostris extrusa]|uniref:Uncharacterized protein n=1 Tax=Caerostris extrusa TaxID=172846 RepID=A0AAV4R0K6_CAEEX|nr:hypothetical protein CEXT_57961 [Caerostris extrusa]